ncbi:hypothetical protein PybrP1_006330 [[Pythium] brassicae (nom. inval.)]|nr:hypothetical protein PybrP1_006330 [[Pythium] brassicae (nom. inval.)]
MAYADGVLAALRPRSLFASACPVLVTLALLVTSPNRPVRLSLDALTALTIALLVQLLANLSAVFRNFHRSFEPLKTQGADGRVVINLLSQTQVRRWAIALVVVMLFALGGCHVALEKPPRVTGGAVALVAAAFVYCRFVDELPIVGLEELVFAAATGPVAMCATAFYLTGAHSWLVFFYSLPVAMFTLSFLILKSAKDAPFARRMGKSSKSLALRLDFQLSYQLFLLLAALSYAALFVLGMGLGHVGNFVLLASVTRLRDIADDFREEQLEQLPDAMAKLGGLLGAGLALSITGCGLLLY